MIFYWKSYYERITMSWVNKSRTVWVFSSDGERGSTKFVSQGLTEKDRFFNISSTVHKCILSTMAEIAALSHWTSPWGRGQIGAELMSQTWEDLLGDTSSVDFRKKKALYIPTRPGEEEATVLVSGSFHGGWRLLQVILAPVPGSSIGRHRLTQFGDCIYPMLRQPV